MSEISRYIENINLQKRKALSVFLTAGFPDPGKFVTLAKDVYSSGADILEIGIPFSDPIADGPVIQRSSQLALQNGITLHKTLQYCEQIKKNIKQPLILMGYSNPVLKYDIRQFMQDATNCGVDGVIIPDIPLEEYDDFWGIGDQEIDIILLTTPTSSNDRIQAIDQKSAGFVYCVSMTGTTGIKDKFNAIVIQNLNRTYKLIKKNKMLVGFGISSPNDISRFSPYCDGVIIGIAVIKSLMDTKLESYKPTLDMVSNLSHACNQLPLTNDQ
jgi:tryptophan synthase alpha chain